MNFRGKNTLLRANGNFSLEKAELHDEVDLTVKIKSEVDFPFKRMIFMFSNPQADQIITQENHLVQGETLGQTVKVFVKKEMKGNLSLERVVLTQVA